MLLEDPALQPWSLLPGNYRRPGREINLSDLIAQGLTKLVIPDWYCLISLVNESHCSQMKVEVSGTRKSWADESMSNPRKEEMLIIVLDVLVEPTIEDALRMTETRLMDRIRFCIFLGRDADTFTVSRGIKLDGLHQNWTQQCAEVVDGMRSLARRGLELCFKIEVIAKVEELTDFHRFYLNLTEDFDVAPSIAQALMKLFPDWYEFGQCAQQIYESGDSCGRVYAWLHCLGIEHRSALSIVSHMLGMDYFVLADTEDFNDDPHADVLFDRYSDNIMAVQGGGSESDMFDID